MKDYILIEIPFKAPTLNMMYATFNGNRIKSKQARDFSIAVKEIVEKMKINISNLKDKRLTVNINIYSKWYNNNNTIKKKDLASYEKAITDSIFSALGIDDSQIFTILMNKHNSDKENIEYYINTI